MPGKISLHVSDGKYKGRKFEYSDPDTFILGRMIDCHICLPDDTLVSRHHFFLELNPPDVHIRDLGSLNGTYVNGQKIGSRLPHETPEEGAKRQYPEVDLKNEDEIRVGDTKLNVIIEIPEFTREPIVCQKCGRDVTEEAGIGRQGDYICEKCRKEAEIDPSLWIHKFLEELSLDQSKQPGCGDLPKVHLPTYEFVSVLGVGGFGAVYLMQHKQSEEKIALKLMLPKKATDVSTRKRFLREMKITETFKHKNIVPFIDFGSQGNLFYFLMEYCEGGDITNLMKKHGGKLPLVVAKPFVFQALEGLAYVHQNGFVHRDLKPQNILLAIDNGEWIAKVSDMGLAKNFIKAGFSTITETGDVAGSVQYMPKEQITNFKYVKPATDVYSIGATIYTMLTGNPPLDFPRFRDPIGIILKWDIVPIRKRDPKIPVDITQVIDRCLEELPEKRYKNADELLDALKKVWK